MEKMRKYRLFGKINVFDILLVVAVIALIYVVYLFAFARQVDATGRTVRFTVEFGTRPVGFHNQIALGSIAMDSRTDVEIGEIVYVYGRPFWREVDDLYYNIIRRDLCEDFEFTYVVIETTANVSELSIEVNDVRLAVNLMISVRSRDIAGNGWITHMEILD